MTRQEALVVAAVVVAAIVVVAKYPEVTTALGSRVGQPRAEYRIGGWAPPRCDPPYCGYTRPGSRFLPRPFMRGEDEYMRSEDDYWRPRTTVCRRFPRMPNSRFTVDGRDDFFPPGMPWDGPVGMPTSWRGSWCVGAAGAPTYCQTDRRRPVRIVA